MIYLHLGAHKTATTYLQAILELNQGRIAAAGRAYWQIDQLRPLIEAGIKDYFPAKGPLGRMRRLMSVKTGAYRGLRGLLSVDRPCIVSDENMLGHAYETLRGRFYPNARRRLDYMQYVIGERPVEIWLCVRAYSSFLTSMYAEAQRHGYGATIAEFVASNPSPAGQWPALVSLAHQVFPKARVVIWAYEDLAVLESQILERLTGLEAGQLASLSHGGLRPSPSARAIQLQSERARTLSSPERMLSMAALETQYPPQVGAGRFNPWDAASGAAMSAAYESDLKILAALDYVEFLRPPLAGNG